MIVERIPITDRATWLALRQRDVTASVAGALLGVHEYQTAFGLWALKSGRVTEDPAETPAMRRGRLLEDDALQILAEDRPDWDVTPANDVYFRAPALRIGATPDAFAVDPRRPGRGVIQVKTVEPSKFRRAWLGEGDGAEVPLWIAIQAIVEARLTGADWAAVAAMTVGYGLELHVIDVPIHDGVFGKLVDEVMAFWRLVDGGDHPPPDYGRDFATIDRMFRAGGGAELDLSADNMLPGLLDERERLSSERKTIDDRLKQIRAEILFKVGDATAARVADGRLITAKTIEKKPYHVVPKPYRDVRVKGPAA